MKENTRIDKVLLIGVMVGIWLVIAVHSVCQAQSPGEEHPVNTGIKSDTAIETLNAILWSIQDMSTQLEAKKHELKQAQTEAEQSDIQHEITQLKAKMDSLQHNFEKIATGVSLEAADKQAKKEFDWKNEVMKLLEPLVQELNKMTARPRQIESLRNQAADLEERLSLVKTAAANIDKLIRNAGDENKKLKENLKPMKEVWAERERHLNDQLTVLRYQLNELLSQRQSILNTAQDFVKSFFMSRGRNLVLALGAFLGVFFLLRYLHRVMHRYSPIHQSKEGRVYVRAIDVAYYILIGIGSTASALVVLYLAGDWVLLSLAILFLLGIVWTAKEGIPRFWRQIQLMLNLGYVKEGERIIYKGVPWRVSTLSLTAVLENPALQPGVLRLPLTEIMEIHSRPYHENEPWFPCNMGDWVILSDGTRGQTVSQTFEMVQLVLRGGAKKTYSTPDFLGMNPMNISGSFRLKVIFGLDYAHQANITREIPVMLADAVRQGLTDKGYGDDIVQIKAELDSASASSLDLVIIADFNGRAAALYNALRRMIQAIAVDASTANGWGIPFPQITVHTQEPFRIRHHHEKDGVQK
jgi:predicted  nucleic acid-binding Zn-ribbon protein